MNVVQIENTAARLREEIERTDADILWTDEQVEKCERQGGLWRQYSEQLRRRRAQLEAELQRQPKQDGTLTVAKV